MHLPAYHAHVSPIKTWHNAAIPSTASSIPRGVTEFALFARAADISADQSSMIDPTHYTGARQPFFAHSQGLTSLRSLPSLPLQLLLQTSVLACTRSTTRPVERTLTSTCR